MRSFPDNRKNKVILRQLAIIYAQAKMSQEALDCFDYLLNEYPMFIPSYANAILYCILINDKKRVSKYWTQYNEITDEKSNETYQWLSAKVDFYLTEASDDSNYKETMCSLKYANLEDEIELEDDFDEKKDYFGEFLEEDGLDLTKEDAQMELGVSMLSVSSGFFIPSPPAISEEKTDRLKEILKIGSV